MNCYNLFKKNHNIKFIMKVNNRGMKNNKEITDIKEKIVSKIYKYSNDNEVKISILDAKYGIYDGKEMLLDEPIVDNMIDKIYKVISKNTSKYNVMPKSIILSQKPDISALLNESKSQVKNSDENYEKILSSYNPQYNFDKVYICKEAKKQILSSISIIKNKKKLFEEWGLENTIKDNRAIVLNFYGPPGTGKSMTAEAIANYLNKRVLRVNYSELESKYVGETPKNIKKIFEIAKEQDSVLILDEADSFLGKRLTNVSQSADYGVNITRSVMLLELEKFDGIVIFTTNLLSNYDEAFKRRILANVEFNLPDEYGRKVIWETHIPKEFPISDEVTLEWLSKNYEDISGADIKDIVLYAGVNALEDNRDIVIKEDFNLAYNYIKNRYINDNKNFNKFENIKIKTTKVSEEEYLNQLKEEDSCYQK